MSRTALIHLKRSDPVLAPALATDMDHDPFWVHIQVESRPSRSTPVKPSHAIKPISYLKAHAAEMIREVADQHATIIITQNGEARAVLQDIGAYERLQDSVALLKILALSQKSVRDGRVAPAGEVFRRVRKRLKANP